MADDTTHTAELELASDILSAFKAANQLNREQNLKDFFRRPTQFSNGNLTSADGVRPVGWSPIGIFSQLLSLPIYANKIAGLRGIRASTIFTLQVNATRFTQGRYILAFIPSGGSTRTNAIYSLNANIASLMQRTQLPHVEVDLNCDSQVTLKVPFASSYLYYATEGATQSNTTSPGNIGYVDFYTYIAANSGTNTEYRLWVHFEDVEFYMPSVPQSAAEGEQKKAGIGPVESAARLTSTVLQGIQKIPVLSDYARPLRWVADITGNAAAAFGWSKPEIASPIMVVGRNRGYQNTNVDGADMSIKLAYSSKNEVSVVAGVAGTNIDEMSLKYIQSIPAWFRTLNWNVSNNTSGTLLASINLSPSSFTNSFVISTVAANSIPPCSFPQVFMQKYRGSFKFRLKFVKTEFHTGRISVVFVPWNQYGGFSVSSGYNASHWVNRQILDVKFGNEWTLEFPYTQSSAYLPTGSWYGRVEFYIENDLQAPPTVAQTVNILLEVMGGDDLEYAEPTYIQNVPFLPSTAQSGQFECEAYDEVIGTSNSKSDGELYAQVCIGERIMSLRQLLKIAQPRFFSNGPLGIQSAKAYGTLMQCYPWSIEMSMPSTATPGFASAPALSCDFFTLFGSLFAMGRGSVRLKIFNQCPPSAGAVFIYKTGVPATGTGQYTPGDVVTGDQTNHTLATQQLYPVLASGNMLCQVPVQDGLTGEIQCPMYNSTFAYPTRDTMTITNDASNQMTINLASVIPSYTVLATNVQQVLANGTANAKPTTMQAYFLRSAGDDFSFHQFISVPLMVPTFSTLVSGTGGMYGPAFVPV